MGIEFEFVHKGKVVDTGVFDHEDDALIACNTVEMNLGLPEWSVGCRVATKIEEEKMKKFEVFKWEKLIRGTNSRGYTYTRAGNKELLATINAVSYREAHFKATKLAKEQGFSVRLLQVKLIKLRRRNKMGNMSYCRFHNTALALEDCVDSWDDDDLSGMETRGKNTIIKLARQIVEMEEENNGKI